MLVPRPLVFVTAATFIVLGVLLLFVILYGGLRHAWNEVQGKDLEFHNTTDTLLCIGSGGPASSQCALLSGGGFAEIKPRSTLLWSTGHCSGSREIITVYEPETERIIYDKSVECGGFDGAIININERDGEFVVADSLPSP